MEWLKYLGIFLVSAVWIGGSAALFAQGATYRKWPLIFLGASGGASFLATLAVVTGH